MLWLLLCFSILFCGCDTKPKERLFAPTQTGRIESNKADGDGIVVKSQKGDPDGTGNESKRMGLGNNMDGTPLQLGD